MPESMNELEAIEMFSMVFGNPAMSPFEVRNMFYQQEPSIIEGWYRLARSINRVTTHETLKHIASKEV